MAEHIAGEHTVAMLKARLTSPFTVSDIRFKKGGGGKWYPYFDNDAYMIRLNWAVDRWDLIMEPWEWRATYVAAYGHLEIPGFGRRAGIGVQEHTSNAGNEMGADMIKGLRADLLKNCAIMFGCGAQFRSMDPISFDPDIPENRPRLDNYLDYYFPEGKTSTMAPLPSQAPLPASGNQNSLLDEALAMLSHMKMETYQGWKNWIGEEFGVRPEDLTEDNALFVLDTIKAQQNKAK